MDNNYCAPILDKETSLRKIALELASRSMEINATTLPEILKNAETIYEWLIK